MVKTKNGVGSIVNPGQRNLTSKLARFVLDYLAFAGGNLSA